MFKAKFIESDSRNKEMEPIGMLPYLKQNLISHAKHKQQASCYVLVSFYDIIKARLCRFFHHFFHGKWHIIHVAHKKRKIEWKNYVDESSVSITSYQSQN